MWTKKKKKIEDQRKIALEMLEFLFISFIVALFAFGFLYFTSCSIAMTYLDGKGVILDEEKKMVLVLWIRSSCLLASVVVFVLLFLFLFGQKVSYLISIIHGVKALEERQMDFEIPLEGNDEFTQLAESINYLALSQKLLKEKEENLKKEREEMIRSISHDIRTPLTSILSYSEYMQKKEDWSKEEIKSYMELMQGKAEQIKSLTNQLIGKKERKLEFIDNGKILIEQLVMEWEELLEDRFPCEVIWNECNNFSGIFDISELRRIFDNLRSNVEKYGDPKQSVKLEVITGKDKLVLIQENGVRTEGELEVESNKIGLNNIRQIVGMYDGEVEVTKSEKEFRIQMIIPVKKVL